jgi:hypothetical protein
MLPRSCLALLVPAALRSLIRKTVTTYRRHEHRSDGEHPQMLSGRARDADGWRHRRLGAAAAVLAGLFLAACSGSEGPDDTLAPAALVTLKDATFAGKTSAPDMFVAVVTHPGGVTAYFCDGKRDFWFRGLAVDSAMEMTEPSGASVVLEVTDEAVVGRLTVGDTVTPFEIPRASADSLYRAETYMGGQRILGGWIVLPGGEQRGVIRNAGAPVGSTLTLSNSVPVVACTSCDAFAGALVPAVFDSNAAVGLRNKPGHEFTVIGLGDSFMAGEGAPVAAGLYVIGESFPIIPEIWSDGLPTSRGSRSFGLSGAERERLAREARACHRGAAGLTLAVESLRRSWPASVDIIHQTFACSGAKIEQLVSTTYSGPANCPQFAVSDPNYAYCLTISDDMPTRSIRPQVTEAVDFLRKSSLKADAVVMSVGGNDLGFGAVIADCLAPFSDCGRAGSTARSVVAAGIDALPGRYRTLADRLVAERIPRSNVFLTSHPNPLRASAGRLCAGGDFAPDLLLMNLSAANAAFGTSVHAEINAQVAAAVSANGWRAITSMLGTEEGHGMCTSEPWYNTRNAALISQGEDLPSDNGLLNFASVFSSIFKVELSAGMFHPNARGQREGYMPAYREVLTSALVLRFTPQPPSRFRVGQVYDDGSVNFVWDDINDFESKTEIRNTVTNQVFEAAADRTSRIVPVGGGPATFRARACFRGPEGQDICSVETAPVTVEARRPTHTPQVTLNQAAPLVRETTLAWNDLAPTRVWTTVELIDPAGVVTKRAVPGQSIILPNVTAGTRFRLAACNDLGCGPPTARADLARSGLLDLAPCPAFQRRQSDGACRSVGNVALPPGG